MRVSRFAARNEPRNRLTHYAEDFQFEEETGGLTVLGGKCYNARRSAGLAEGGAARAAPTGPEA